MEYNLEYNIDTAEVSRYLGIKGAPDAKTRQLIYECSQLLLSAVKPKYIYRTFPIKQTKNQIILCDTEITLTGTCAASYLYGCTSCAVLGATLGIEADNLIRIYQNTNMAKAVILDACATDLIEKVCDCAMSEIESSLANGFHLSDRFSPGYGDLPLSLQKNICSVLSLDRKIGLYLTDELLLLPTKSVTAFIGIGMHTTHNTSGCFSCNMKNKCSFCNI